MHFDVVIYLLGNPKVYRGIVVNNKYLEILPYLSYLHITSSFLVRCFGQK